MAEVNSLIKPQSALREPELPSHRAYGGGLVSAPNGNTDLSVARRRRA
jgi:hypothetical protein